MSSEEEITYIGSIAKQFKDTKKVLAELEAEARRIGLTMQSIAKILIDKPENLIFREQGAKPLIGGSREFDSIAQDTAKLPNLVETLRATKEQYEQLDLQLKKWGIRD